jgi:uncharacterized protein YvpB
MKFYYVLFTCILITACGAQIASYDACIAANNAQITNDYCEVAGTRFFPPVQSNQQSVASIQSSVFSLQQSVSSSEQVETGKEQRPTSVRLQVPFTVQAPTANWNPPFDEACEEASYLMVEYMLQGKTFTPESATAAITELAEYQHNNGYAIDITIEELAQIAQTKFGRDTQVFTGNDVTVEHIEELVSSGYPVIIPAAGQLLNNPYFSGDGPPYHMLVITGYDAKNFITNDPGTKRGEGFTYKKDHLVSVIHNWNGSTTTITSGPKAMMVVAK